MPYTTADITFADRHDAGERLADMLVDRQWVEPLVLGLARGGVPVADAVAERLDAQLDILVSRKIGAPGQPEFGVGAVTAEGPAYFHEDSLRRLGLTPSDLADSTAAERAEARRRVRHYHQGREHIPRHDRDILVVDDGLATGVTATAALRTVAEDAPRRVVFAAPVCAPESVDRLRREADDVVCVATPEGFGAVGMWYRDFHQTTDERVVSLLEAARGRTLGE
ncbi:MAG: phosphoribosyltransferase [Actinophytocola sp.]|nr:phosphoribosyltransferase [Actinophytocola sp.]